MNERNLIFLCGFMCCGKTTQGKQLAKQLGYHFIDLDSYIENKHNNNIAELFKEVGEPEFRNIETESLKECIENNIKTIIALGGGTPCFNNNIALLKQNGLLIYLQMNPTDLYERLFSEKSNRPLLKDKVDNEMLNYIEQLLKLREPVYTQAHIQINSTRLNTDELKQAVLAYSQKS